MKANQRNILKLLGLLGQFLLLVGLVVFIISTKNKNKDNLCQEIDIQINNNQQNWIKETDINAIITQHGNQVLINNPVTNIDLKQLEDNLKKSPYVSQAEAQFNMKGKLFVQVALKSAKYRIINNQGVHYYIDNNGLQLPFSNNFTPNVPVVQGYIPMVDTVFSEPINQNVWKVLEYIEQDEVLNALIGSIYVDNNEEINLIPVIDQHQILIGNTDNLNEKMEHIRLFYKQALTKTNWHQYHTIDVRYNNQIICKKTT